MDRYDAYSPAFDTVFSFIIDKSMGTPILKDVQIVSPMGKPLDPEKFLGKTVELVSFEHGLLFTLSFDSDIKNIQKPKIKVEGIDKDTTFQFRDLETGLVTNIFLNSDKKIKYYSFDVASGQLSSPVAFEGQTPSEKFFYNRVLRGYSVDQKYKVELSFGPSGFDGGLRDYKIDQISPKDIRVRDFISVHPLSEAETDDVTAELKALIEKTRKLPGIGKRMAIIDSLVSKIEAAKAEQTIFGAKAGAGNSHELLGSIVQDFGHMALLGNPGTLKTVFADIFYLALKAEGFIKGPMLRINGRDIVQGYIGQTEQAMQKIIDEVVAKNGMLFVDEFHALDDTGMGGKGREYGANAARMLIAAMENKRDKFVCMIAGYPEPMKQAIKNIDQGLKDRLSDTFTFDDYNPDELEDIFYYLLPEGYSLNKSAKTHIRKIIQEGYEDRDQTFSNGRAIRNLVQRVVNNTKTRLKDEGVYSEIAHASKSPEGLTEQARKAFAKRMRTVTLRDVETLSFDPLSKVGEDQKRAPIGFDIPRAPSMPQPTVRWVSKAPANQDSNRQRPNRRGTKGPA